MPWQDMATRANSRFFLRGLGRHEPRLEAVFVSVEDGFRLLHGKQTLHDAGKLAVSPLHDKNTEAKLVKQTKDDGQIAANIFGFGGYLKMADIPGTFGLWVPMCGDENGTVVVIRGIADFVVQVDFSVPKENFLHVQINDMMGEPLFDYMSFPNERMCELVRRVKNWLCTHGNSAGELLHIHQKFHIVHGTKNITKCTNSDTLLSSFLPILDLNRLTAPPDYDATPQTKKRALPHTKYPPCLPPFKHRRITSPTTSAPNPASSGESSDVSSDFTGTTTEALKVREPGKCRVTA